MRIGLEGAAMRRLIATLSLVSVLTLGAMAQADKAELENQMGLDSYLGKRSAVLLDKLVDLKITPKWLEFFTNDKDARNSLRNLVDALGTVANNLGWGDVGTLDSTRDSTSPIFLDTVAGWKDKLHMTLVMEQDLDDKGRALAMRKFDTVIYPITWAKPRSNKYFITVKMDPKAKAATYTSDKEHAHFTLVFPVYMDIVQSTLQELVQRAN